MFAGMNRHQLFNDGFLFKYSLDGYLRVPMTDESIVVPADLLSGLFGAISGFKGIGKG